MSKEDILISLDLDDTSYCNGAYGGPSNIRVDAEAGCDTKERRFYFFAAGDIVEGTDIIQNYGTFAISSGWAEFGL